jgi:tetratricopeptide (TPR) repeat protein
MIRPNGAIVTTSSELVIRAGGLLSAMQFPEAEQCLRQAAAMNPDSVAALVGLGRLALLDRRVDEGLALLERASSLQPDCAEALALQGIYWMQQERFDRAIELLEKARAVDPKLAMIHFNLGECRCRLGEFPLAEGDLRRAIESSPGHFQAYSRLSYVQVETGNWEDAVRSMRQAVRINPAYVEGYLVLGSLFERAGKHDVVIRVYRSGIRRNPAAFSLRERLCAAYALHRDFTSAFQEALEIANRRNLYTDYLRLGSYAVALLQFETAERAFQRSLELNPSSWEGHYNLAEMYMSAGRMDDAGVQYQAALDHNSGGYEPLNGMGLFVLLIDQDCDKAIGFFKEAIDLAPSHPEPRWNMALACARKGDFPTAQKFAASVLALVKPGDPLHHQAERLQGTIRIESHTLQVLK